MGVLSIAITLFWSSALEGPSEHGTLAALAFTPRPYEPLNSTGVLILTSRSRHARTAQPPPRLCGAATKPELFSAMPAVSS
jgi:hypothetical protein